MIATDVKVFSYHFFFSYSNNNVNAMSNKKLKTGLLLLAPDH